MQTTQYAQATYQEIIDLHTQANTVSTLGIHTPSNMTPQYMLGGFYKSFKKVKYLGCDLTLVPAARLPVDPAQVGYDDANQAIDARDMLNPIMFKGCHGNDLGAVLNGLYSDWAGQKSTGGVPATQILHSDSVVENTLYPISSLQGDTDVPKVMETLYYRALTDKTWLKSNPQSGFRKSGLHPLVHMLATNFPANFTADNSMMPPYAGLSIGAKSAPEDNLDNVYGGIGTSIAGASPNSVGSSSGQLKTAGLPSPITLSSTAYGAGNIGGFPQFFTPRMTRLGWLDTVDIHRPKPATTVNADGDDLDEFMNGTQRQSIYARLPKLFMGVLMLPPAYKQEQYFRMVLTHKFAFKSYRGMSMNVQPSFTTEMGGAPAYGDFNDAESA